MYVFFFFSFLNSSGETLSFCWCRHKYTITKSWLVPNKPLVNPPVRCVFLQRDEEDSLSPSLFSLSLSNRKGVFLLRVFLVSFLDSNSKTIRCDDVHTYYSYEIRLETTRAVATRRDTRGRRRRRNRRVSSLSFFRFFFGRSQSLSMLLGWFSLFDI